MPSPVPEPPPREVAGPAFGPHLRSWRERRGASQLDLGLRAEVSARHISFLETGRSRPSRGMVLRLAGALEVPLRERNELLVTAGFAPRYGQRSLDDGEMAEARRALQFILDMHEPYPAFVLDRRWRIILWNRAQGFMLRELHGPNGSPADLSALDLVFSPGPTRESFLNWEEVARAVLRRLQRQVVRAGEDEEMTALWDRIRDLPGVGELELAEDAGRPAPVLVPMRMKAGDQLLTWYSTLAVFGATGDVTLEELVIESFFPGDDATRAFVREVAEMAGGSAQSSERPGDEVGREEEPAGGGTEVDAGERRQAGSRRKRGRPVKKKARATRKRR